MEDYIKFKKQNRAHQKHHIKSFMNIFFVPTICLTLNFWFIRTLGIEAECLWVFSDIFVSIIVLWVFWQIKQLIVLSLHVMLFLAILNYCWMLATFGTLFVTHNFLFFFLYFDPIAWSLFVSLYFNTNAIHRFIHAILAVLNISVTCIVLFAAIVQHTHRYKEWAEMKNILKFKHGRNVAEEHWARVFIPKDLLETIKQFRVEVDESWEELMYSRLTDDKMFIAEFLPEFWFDSPFSPCEHLNNKEYQEFDKIVLIYFYLYLVWMMLSVLCINLFT